MLIRRLVGAGFRRQQLLIVLAAVAPFLVLSVLILVWGMREFRSAVDRGLLNTAGALATAVDRQVVAWEASLYSLADSPAFDNGDFRTLYGHAIAIAQRHNGDIVLFDGNLQQVLNTEKPLGTALPEARYPEPIRRAFVTGQPQISGPFFGAVAQRWIVSVDIPVRRNGSVIYDLDMYFEPVVLNELLAEQELPGGWVAAIVNEANTIIAHSPGPADLRGSTVAPWYSEAVATHTSGIASGPSAAGAPVVAAFESLSSAPWSVRVAAPTSALSPDWQAPILIFAGLTLLAIGAAAGGAWLSSRRVTRPIEALAHSAADGLAGRPAKLAPMPILEFETLRLALERAAITARESIAAEERALAAEESAASLRESERRQWMLASEIEHRSKNLLTLVLAILEQTRADNVEDFIAAFSGRVMALARANNLLANSRWEGADLRQILEEELAPYRSGEGRTEISGPTLTIAPMAAQAIALALHEMCTNAVKYGALSRPAGRLSVRWETTQDQLVLYWTETGGFAIPASLTGKGFGTKMITGMFTQQLGGHVEFDWRDEGLHATITLPLAQLRESAR